MACVLYQLLLLVATLLQRRKHGVEAGRQLLNFTVAVNVERGGKVARERNFFCCIGELLNWSRCAAGHPPSGYACKQNANRAKRQ